MAKIKIPYGKQCIDEDDMKAVCEVLSSDWLTTGPKVEEFERSVADYVGCTHGVAVSSGTSALHCAMYALDIGPGDEVIVPAITFAATANAVVFQGGVPVFADVDPETLLIDLNCVESLVTERTKAIIAVDYAGQPCDYSSLRELAEKYNLCLVADACHSLGAQYHGQKVGTLADITLFSFHPVKHITTGEGGMAVTDDAEYARRMRLFRNHGISTDFRQREMKSSWHYEMIDLGFNYRISDFQCALGVSQLKKLPDFLAKRSHLAKEYLEYFANVSDITPLRISPDISHAWHLYVVKLASGEIRDRVFEQMRSAGVGVNVHYIPVHLHPYYQKKLGTRKGLCPKAEKAYELILTLPLWPGMKDEDMKTVAELLKRLV